MPAGILGRTSGIEPPCEQLSASPQNHWIGIECLERLEGFEPSLRRWRRRVLAVEHYGRI